MAGLSPLLQSLTVALASLATLLDALPAALEPLAPPLEPLAARIFAVGLAFFLASSPVLSLGAQERGPRLVAGSLPLQGLAAGLQTLSAVLDAFAALLGMLSLTLEPLATLLHPLALPGTGRPRAQQSYGDRATPDPARVHLVLLGRIRSRARLSKQDAMGFRSKIAEIRALLPSDEANRLC
jgi:hypothetical protein